MYKYKLVRTAFHGGGLISHHKTEAAADRALRRYVSGTDLVHTMAMSG